MWQLEQFRGGRRHEIGTRHSKKIEFRGRWVQAIQRTRKRDHTFELVMGIGLGNVYVYSTGPGTDSKIDRRDP